MAKMRTAGVNNARYNDGKIIRESIIPGRRATKTVGKTNASGTNSKTSETNGHGINARLVPNKANSSEVEQCNS